MIEQNSLADGRAERFEEMRKRMAQDPRMQKRKEGRQPGPNEHFSQPLRGAENKITVVMPRHWNDPVTKKTPWPTQSWAETIVYLETEPGVFFGWGLLRHQTIHKLYRDRRMTLWVIGADGKRYQGTYFYDKSRGYIWQLKGNRFEP